MKQFGFFGSFIARTPKLIWIWETFIQKKTKSGNFVHEYSGHRFEINYGNCVIRVQEKFIFKKQLTRLVSNSKIISSERLSKIRAEKEKHISSVIYSQIKNR